MNLFEPYDEIKPQILLKNMRLEGFRQALRAVGAEMFHEVRSNAPMYRWKGVEERCDDQSMAAIRYAISDACKTFKANGECAALWGRDAFYALRDAHVHTNRVDLFVEYLNSLPTIDLGADAIRDYELKCDRLLEDAFEDVEGSVYNRHVSRSITLAAVWRAFEPGCTVHEVPVIKGPQGAGKDTIISHLVPRKEWITTSFSFGRSGKDRVESTQGTVFVIASEMGGINTKKDIEDLKAYITTDEDHARFAYRRDSEIVKRRFVFVCTTNLDKPLPADPSGNRRFCVVEVGPSAVGAIEPWLDKRRDGLWQEALALYRLGASPRLPFEMRDFQAGLNDDQGRVDEQMEDAYNQAFDEGKIKADHLYTLTQLALMMGLANSPDDWRRSDKVMEHRCRDQLLSRGWTMRRERRFGSEKVERLWGMR